jgi:hypothetical protein
VSEAKHTPGQWSVVLAGPRKDVVWVDFEHKYEGGASYGTVCELVSRGLQQSKADAHLIAAAPDLLAFAIDMRDRHRPHGERNRCLSCGLDGDCCSVHHAAVAVIAKAEGK